MFKQNNLKGSLILVFTALIWGLAFVAQSAASDHVPPFFLNGLRSIIGAAFLCVAVAVRSRHKHTAFLPVSCNDRMALLKSGIFCGFLLTVSVNFQQFGLWLYPEGVAAEARGSFITALYVILVPLIGAFSGKRISLMIWGSVALAVAGIYMLCLWKGLNGLYTGDILIFICAISFTLHILTVDRFVIRVDGVRLSMMQFLVCGVLSCILSLVFENKTVMWSGVLAAAPQILYLGIMSSGIAYTLQIIGQRYAEPAVASLAMSLESVFGALGGWVLMGNTLSVPEFIGCVLVFSAIVLAQMPQLIINRRAHKS